MSLPPFATTSTPSFFPPLLTSLTNPHHAPRPLHPTLAASSFLMISTSPRRRRDAFPPRMIPRPLHYSTLLVTKSSLHVVHPNRSRARERRDYASARSTPRRASNVRASRSTTWTDRSSCAYPPHVDRNTPVRLLSSALPACLPRACLPADLTPSRSHPLNRSMSVNDVYAGVSLLVAPFSHLD